jgi:hypothetical protein
MLPGNSVIRFTGIRGVQVRGAVTTINFGCEQNSHWHADCSEESETAEFTQLAHTAGGTRDNCGVRYHRQL